MAAVHALGEDAKAAVRELPYEALALLLQGAGAFC